MIAIFRLLTVLFLLGGTIVGAEGPSDPVTLTLVAEENTVQPGQTFWVALHVKMEPHWHAYWKNPGDAGMPLTVNWTVPEGFEVGEISWPTPQRFSVDTSVGYGYEGEAILLALVKAPKDFHSAVLAADVRWVVCDESTCLPGESHAEVKVAPGKPAGNPANTAYFQTAKDRIPKKSNSIAVTRKDKTIEISVPKDLVGASVSKAEFFPDAAMAMATDVTPNVVPTDSHNKVFLQDDGSNSSCKGVMVLHTEGDTVAYEVDAAVKSHLIAERDPIQIDRTSPSDEFNFEGGVFLAICLAFLGGMILNLMPCVLPVISFKVLGFIKLAGQSRKLIFQHGLAFCMGVLLSFWVLAGALLILQSYGNSVGWGFQLQEPMFVMALASFVFIFALSLFGVFEMGTSLIGLMGNSNSAAADKRNELLSSFFSGIMATAVATPCTGPFLGSAVGFAVTLPPIEAMASLHR